MQGLAVDRMDQMLDVRTVLRTIALTKVLVSHIFKKEHYKMLAFQRHDRYILDNKATSINDDEPSSSEELFNLFHGEGDYDQRQLEALKKQVQMIEDRSKLDIEERETAKVRKLLEGIIGRNQVK